jgi:hypothetical protein
VIDPDAVQANPAAFRFINEVISRLILPIPTRALGVMLTLIS